MSTTPAKLPSPPLSAGELRRRAESMAVDAQMAYNRMGQASSQGLFTRERRLVWAVRVIGLTFCLAAGALGVAQYYLAAKIYRVRRIRHPGRVRLARHLSFGCSGAMVCCLLALWSPYYGLFMRFDDIERQKRKANEAAMRVLLLSQNCFTIAAFSGSSGSRASAAPPNDAAGVPEMTAENYAFDWVAVRRGVEEEEEEETDGRNAAASSAGLTVTRRDARRQPQLLRDALALCEAEWRQLQPLL